MSEGNRKLVVAAVADLHVREGPGPSYRNLFEEISDAADVLVIAGDLTDMGKPLQARA